MMINKLLIIIFVVLFVSGCVALDGSPRKIAWMELPTEQDVVHKCADLAGTIKGAGRACYAWSGDVCYVITSKAKDGYDTDVEYQLGHETRHCFKGHYH